VYPLELTNTVEAQCSWAGYVATVMTTVLKTVEMQAGSARRLQMSVKGDVSICLSFSVSCFYVCPDLVFMSVYGL